MKKFMFLVLLFAAFLAFSCDSKDESWIIDWVPLDMYVYLSDADGESLFDPNNEDAFDSSKIVITYDGKEYGVRDYLSPSEPTAQPMDVLAYFSGARIDADRYGVPVMIIGEWARNAKWDVSVDVAWGDGTSDTFALSHDYTCNPRHRNNPDKNWGYEFTSKFYLNGEPNEGAVYHIVKNKSGNNNNENIIVDWAPIRLFVYLSDADGNNLLDPDCVHAYDSANMVLAYDGEEYELINHLSNSEPKARTMEYLAVFDAPYISRDTKGVACLTIGEWGRVDKWDMASVEISWGDGTSDMFAFSHDYTYNPEYCNDADNGWGYTFTTQYYLNGESHDGCMYYLVK